MLGARGEAGSRLATLRAVAEARRFVTLAAFELRLLPARLWLDRTGGVSIEALDRLATAGFVVIEQAPDPAARQDDQAISAWLSVCADHVAPGGTAILPPKPDLPPPQTAAGALLRSELDHALAR